MAYCVKSQFHWGPGKASEKVVVTDYEFQSRESAGAAVMEHARRAAGHGDEIFHIEGLSVVVHANGSYETFWRAGDE